MKKTVKMMYLVAMLVFVPFSFVMSLACTFRLVMNKPIYYNNLGNKNCNTNISTKSDSACANYFDVTKIKYAKIKENCYLFKTSDVTNSSYSNMFFILPETYFVVVLTEVNSMITKVQYKNKVGYVSSDSISKVDFIPVTPYLNSITFDVYDDVGTQLRSSPDVETSANVKMIIPAGTSSIDYIASIMGAIPTGGSSNVWYYCTFTPESDPTSVYEGYVYSGKTQNLSTITPNLESSNEATLESSEEDEDKLTMNQTVKVILIVLICIPIVLVFVLLIVQNKKNKSSNEAYQDHDDKAVKGKKVKIEDVDIEPKQNNEGITNNKLVKFKSSRKSLRDVDDFKGTQMTKKSPYYAKFISTESDDNSLSPAFPTYEVIDDEDLL